MEFFCFFYDSENVGYLISGSSIFSEPAFTSVIYGFIFFCFFFLMCLYIFHLSLSLYDILIDKALSQKITLKLGYKYIIKSIINKSNQFILNSDLKL